MSSRDYPGVFYPSDCSLDDNYILDISYVSDQGMGPFSHELYFHSFMVDSSMLEIFTPELSYPHPGTED